MEQLLDEYVQRLQQMPPFTLSQLDGDKVVPWWTVADVVKDLVIHEQTLGYQVQIVSGEINKWHRLAAGQRRIWQVQERHYRVWRDKFYLEAINPEGKPDDWKKPSEKQVESMYRAHKDYAKYNRAIEEAEEAYNCCLGVVEALRAKRDMLRSYVLKNRDDGSAILTA